MFSCKFWEISTNTFFPDGCFWTQTSCFIFFSNCSSLFLTISHKNYIVNRVFKSFISNQKLSIEIIKNKIKNRLQRKSNEKKTTSVQDSMISNLRIFYSEASPADWKNVNEFIKKLSVLCEKNCVLRLIQKIPRYK